MPSLRENQHSVAFAAPSVVAYDPRSRLVGTLGPAALPRVPYCVRDVDALTPGVALVRSSSFPVPVRAWVHGTRRRVRRA